VGLAGCDKECDTSAADGDQYATTDGDRCATIAEVAELNSTLAALKLNMMEQIISANARAARFCDALYEKKAFTTSLEKVQDVDTSGAHDWEVFTLDGATYLAVANSYNGGTTNIKSRIYRHSAESGRFELAQEIGRSGAVDWEAFTLNGATYLAVANVGNSTVRNRKSRIYRHSLMLNRFEVTQEVDTSGAIDWEAFTLGGATYLAVANWYNGSTYKLKSRIYRHSSDSDQFELVQEVDTSGAPRLGVFYAERHDLPRSG
jgi:predicted GIY-YIG superfamily endonuclease